MPKSGESGDKMKNSKPTRKPQPYKQSWGITEASLGIIRDIDYWLKNKKAVAINLYNDYRDKEQTLP